MADHHELNPNHVSTRFDGMEELIDEQKRNELSPLRHSVLVILSHQFFESVLGAVIIFNMYIVIVDTDHRAHNNTSDSVFWVEVTNHFLLAIYTVELLLRFFAYRINFFNNMWNNLDFGIVCVDYISLILSGMITMPKVSFLRVIRLMKLMRAVRILLAFPELYMLVKGVVGAMKAIMWGTFLILIVITLYGIMAVELLHPINVRVANKGIYSGCERCPRAFASVPSAIVTFMQTIVTGDSWGQVSIPVMEEQPAAFIFFLGTFITVGLGVTNLILAVIVDRAHEARQDDLKQLAMVKEKETNAAKVKLEELCAKMDTDGNGCVTLEEVTEGFDTVPEFADVLKVMDIKREDLELVYTILDADGSGDIDYHEFAEQLHRMKSLDSHTMIVFVRYYVIRILEETRKGFRRLQGARDSQTSIASADIKANFVPAVQMVKEGTEMEQKLGVAGKRSDFLDNINDELKRLRGISEEMATIVRDVSARSESQMALLTPLREAMPVLQRLAPNAGGDSKGVSSVGMPDDSARSRWSRPIPLSCCSATYGTKGARINMNESPLDQDPASSLALPSAGK